MPFFAAMIESNIQRGFRGAEIVPSDLENVVFTPDQ